MKTSDPKEDKEIEDIKQDEKVQRALSENSTVIQEENTVTLKKEVPFISVTAVIFVIFGALYYLIGWKRLPISSIYIPLAQKVVLAVMLISLVLLATRLLKKIFGRKIENKTTIFNFNRIADLLAALFILVIILSLLFANWYAAMVSFGIVTLILGFALQNLIVSFFGWLYILVRKPYEVGDRIRIGAVYGDVINVSYVDTTLWEFNGDYLSSDHPSGRIIRFANSKVFSEFVYNYSWPLFPFIWNELSIFISYDSDFKFTEDTIIRVVTEEIGEAMVRRVKRFKKILADTPVDELNVTEYPSVVLKANANTWIEVIVRYLVEPKNSGKVKKHLFEAVMNELKKNPDKVIFPNTNKR
ncbi:Small-conductance mechanosensitive channel [Flavobacterium fryxellicola]|uniref:Mechanosensitive ion channel protein MscS n=1 Tax=Flavobacterium fryxellicola TaxID=249352 RepID=A0A168AB21_9FLAO|nr:mechanosensitive ion channel family protein [Flavobacterium fryxellicola]OAB31298.1 mechanosensitive ion channel protein MscS [Flavobacterium fryxellicola]SHN55046.1 Small-conductance mechanosensitive channel [Flavobacterium fryxellicola]